MLRPSLRRLSFFLPLLCPTLTLALLFSQPAWAQATTQNAPPTRKAPPPAVDQQQFISYWTTETGWGTQLELRNNQATGVLAVTPVLRATDGSETDLASVTVQPQDVQTLDVEAAVGTSAPQLIGAYGSVLLRYRASSFSALYAVAMVHGIGHSVALHIDGIGEDQSGITGGREGVWWLPNATASDYLILGNQGKTALPLTLTLFDASGKSAAQNLTLPPAAMNRLSVRQLLKSQGLSGSYGGIQLSAASHAGSLNTLHVVFDENVGFSAFLKMFDYDPRAKLSERDYAASGTWTLRAPMLALSTPDPALAFPFGTRLRPQLLIRNTTAKPIDASLRFTWRHEDVGGKAAGPQLRLLPYETRRIDVAALQDGTTLPKDANWAVVILTSNAVPDELMAVAVSYDQELKYGAQTPFSDQLAFHWAGSQWEYDPHHDSVITVGNGGTKPTTAGLTIVYNQGTQKYELEQTLQPDEQMWIDVGKLIREHVADKNGKTLPQDLTFGSYDIRDLGNKGIGALFEGKIMYDTTYGHVTYGCGVCCAYQPPALWWDPLGIAFQGTSGNGVNAYDTCSNSEEDITYLFNGHWSTANSSIATVNAYGTHTGQGLGPTTTSTWASIQQWRPHSFNCPIGVVRPGGGDNVTPQIHQGSCSGTDITGTTQSVVIGQQIALCATYNLPSGVSVTQQSWSPDSNSTIVGGYNPSTASATIVTAQTNGQSTTFYWVTPGTSVLSFNVVLSNSTAASATTTYNISGPNPSMPAITLPTNGQLNTDTLTGCSADPGGQYLVFGNLTGAVPQCSNPPSATGTAGIQFTPPTTQSPPGTFFFVQLVDTDTVTYSASGSSRTCTSTPGLDLLYPYQNKRGQLVNDAPALELLSTSTMESRSFAATMYLMWQSSTSGSIPAPLGYVDWNFSGSASEPQLNSTWGPATGSGSAGSFVTATSPTFYPTWQGVSVPQSSCH